jgi:CRP/FNR family cyclic AMP-dependent transcriptional regulator
MKIDILKDERNVETYSAGETIFSAGETGDVMYSVVEGRVDIALSGDVLETVEEGGIVGEMAIVDHGPRSASAVARTEVKLTPIDAKRFELIIGHNPNIALLVMRAMTERLRAMNARGHAF